jgi:hypothetical protein
MWIGTALPSAGGAGRRRSLLSWSTLLLRIILCPASDRVILSKPLFLFCDLSRP